jgi:hypothetical protein
VSGGWWESRVKRMATIEWCACHEGEPSVQEGVTSALHGKWILAASRLCGPGHSMLRQMGAYVLVEGCLSHACAASSATWECARNGFVLRDEAVPCWSAVLRAVPAQCCAASGRVLCVCSGEGLGPRQWWLIAATDMSYLSTLCLLGLSLTECCCSA